MSPARLLLRLVLIVAVLIDATLVVGFVLEVFDTDPVATVSEISSLSPSTVVSSTPLVTAMLATSSTQTNASVLRTIDGDTLEARIDGEDAARYIRLLGIDTPETVDPRRSVECFGNAASARLKELVEGKRVRLEADVLADERDTYDRLLRHVFLEDGTDVNALMVREGYAHAYLSYPLHPERRRELRNLEKDAKLHEKGLWSPLTCNGHD